MKDIAFTFGIITDTSNPESRNRINSVLESISNLHIPKYEIIIVGNLKPIDALLSLHRNKGLPIRQIQFQEYPRAGWITKKKNLITKFALYNDIVYQHDYMSYDASWYEAWKQYGDNYHACMNAIINSDGSRYRDWSLFQCDDFKKQAKAFCGAKDQECLLPYDETSLSRFMYFSGAYFVAKKKIMQEFPLDENLSWGQGEDCKWSYQFRQKYQFSINAEAKVKMLKYNHPVFHPVRTEVLHKLKEFVKLKDEGKI